MACMESDLCEAKEVPAPVICPPQDPGIYTDPKRASQHLMAACRCYKEGLYTDVTVIVDGVRFETHRIILAGLSDYFPPLFKLDQAGNGEVTLHEITSDDFAILLQFAYTGEIHLTKDNVQGILMAADYLSIAFLRDSCEVFMSNNLDTDNVCDALRFALNLSFQHLLEQAKDFLSKNLYNVFKSPGFLQLDPHFLISYFDDDSLVFHNARVVMKSSNREKLILKSVLRYMSQTPYPDDDIFAKLTQAVRFPVLPKDLIKKEVKNNKLEKNEILMSLIQKWDIATRCIDAMKKGSSFAQAEAIDAGVPKSWLRPRKLAAYSISSSPRRFAAGGQVARAQNPPIPKLPDDPNFEISKIDLWIRRWDGRPVIGGIKIDYRMIGKDGKGFMCKIGEMCSDWEHHSVDLQPNEYIVSVAVGHGWLIDRLSFVTSFGRSFGPYGGPGGNDHIEKAPKGAESYLHDINCEATTTQGSKAIYNLTLRWITLE